MSVDCLSIADHYNNYQKYLFSTVLKNICSEKFLQIIVKRCVAEFIFSKITMLSAYSYKHL